MFAPKVTKVETTAGASSTNSLARDRSTLVAHRLGQGEVGDPNRASYGEMTLPGNPEPNSGSP
jgi:hypothetical protein